jgi:glutamine amidotransferase
MAEYSAALQKDNFYAVQFHPEKSSAAGEKILKNFVEL